MPRTHYLTDEQVHFTWDTGNEPVLGIDSGDTVVVWTRDVSDNQIGPDSDTSAIAGLDWDRVYPLAGPIEVSGAAPGDTLAVEILDIHTQGWGWTAILPGLGLLADDFPDAYLKIFDISGARLRLDARGRGDPAGPVLRDDGRLPGRGERRAGDAARQLRRQPRHAPARQGRDAVPAGRGRRRDVLLRRRPRLPGRRRGLRHRARGADVREPALHAREGPLDPVAAVPHARPAHSARGRGAVLRHDRDRAGPVRERAAGGAGDDRPHHRHLRRCRPRTRTCSPACAWTSRSRRSSTPGSGWSARCCPRRSSCHARRHVRPRGSPRLGPRRVRALLQHGAEHARHRADLQRP